MLDISNSDGDAVLGRRSYARLGFYREHSMVHDGLHMPSGDLVVCELRAIEG